MTAAPSPTCGGRLRDPISRSKKHQIEWRNASWL
jgi:hypothetical protein